MSPGDAVVRMVGVCKSFHAVEVLRDITFDVYAGEFLSVLGPSGCGKSTCLRILAGFEEPAEGEVWIAGRNASGVPPNRRDVSMVFQDYSLFPHMNIFENVGFGLKERRERREAIREKVGAVLKLVRLEGVETRFPSQLSGGQKQRVAIARSLVLNPTVLLLDEPLGALDLRLRKQMQTELKGIQTQLGITFIYVTHDQEEALSMSDRIIVLDKGTIQQIGTPIEIYTNPLSRFVADFIGETTFMTGVVTGVSDTEAIVSCGRLPVAVNRHALELGQEVVLSVRPENARLNQEGTGLKNRFEGQVLSFAYKGSTYDYRIQLSDGGEIRAIASTKGRRPQPGERVNVGWDPEDIIIIR